jgi:hypothetical protein
MLPYIPEGRFKVRDHFLRNLRLHESEIVSQQNVEPIADENF